MAQYRIHDKDELVACPYDKAELMLAKTLPYHLTHCPKKHLAKFETCPFNARHRIPKAEFRHHLSTCPDRCIIEPELSYAWRKANGQSAQLKGCTDTPSFTDIHIPSTEDWDAEAETPPPVRTVFGNADQCSRAVFTQVSSRPGSASGLRDVGNQRDGFGDGAMAPSSVLQPRAQTVDQPVSSVYAYSISCGHGQEISGSRREGFYSISHRSLDVFTETEQSFTFVTSPLCT